MIAYDLRGHGYASNAPKVEAMQRYVDDLALLLDQLNIRKARIGGLSLGGAIAQMFALQYPDRARTFIPPRFIFTFSVWQLPSAESGGT